MEFLELVFRLGVLLAIFSFIWGIIQLGIVLLRGGMPLPYPLALAMKLIQYFIIVDITVLFCADRGSTMEVDFVLSGFILLMYFVGKVQNAKTKFMVIQLQGREMGRQNNVIPPNMKLEFGVVALGLALFILLCFMPELAENPLSIWFLENSIAIEKTPIIGFIFKIVGFFFTITILIRMINAFTMILSGRAFNSTNEDDRNKRDENHFDDYEEMK